MQEPCEDAVEQLKKYTHGKNNTDKVEISVLALNRIIKALSQEPCEDAVSRQAVLDIIDKWYESNRDVENIEDLIVFATYLPSVLLKPKTGHWIEGEIWEDTDGGWGRWQKCSVCRESEHHKKNFCPNCGTKMVKPHESEEV